MSAVDLGKYNKIVGDERGQLRRELRRRYERGASIRELAEVHGRSYGFVHTLLTEAGTTLRPRGSRRINAA